MKECRRSKANPRKLQYVHMRRCGDGNILASICTHALSIVINNALYGNCRYRPLSRHCHHYHCQQSFGSECFVYTGPNVRMSAPLFPIGVFLLCSLLSYEFCRYATWRHLLIGGNQIYEICVFLRASTLIYFNGNLQNLDDMQRCVRLPPTCIVHAITNICSQSEECSLDPHYHHALCLRCIASHLQQKHAPLHCKFVLSMSQIPMSGTNTNLTILCIVYAIFLSCHSRKWICATTALTSHIPRSLLFWAA